MEELHAGMVRLAVEFVVLIVVLATTGAAVHKPGAETTLPFAQIYFGQSASDVALLPSGQTYITDGVVGTETFDAEEVELHMEGRETVLPSEQTYFLQSASEVALLPSGQTYTTVGVEAPPVSLETDEVPATGQRV